MRYESSTVLAIFFASVLFAPAAFAQQQISQPQQWEYKIVDTCDPKDSGISLRQLGEEGWELVATNLVSEGVCTTRYFKRPKGAEAKQAAKQPPAPQCSLPLDKAPVIRGLRLGMNAEEILPFFSTNSSRAQTQDALKNASADRNYGIASFSLSFSADNSKEVQEKFAGIRYFNFKALDGRVVEIEVIYKTSTEWTEDEWIAKVSNAFDLPGLNNWERRQGAYGKALQCKGFEVAAKVTELSMTITDPTYRQSVKDRAKADREKKQREFVF